jgi:hypothetical protein
MATHKKNILHTSITLVLFLFSATSFGGVLDYTCGDLAFDNKNQTVFAGKYPTLKSVHQLLLGMREYSLQESAKKSAERNFNELKAKNDTNAYAKSLEIYKAYLNVAPNVNESLNTEAIKAGGITKYVSSLCGNSNGTENLPIMGILDTMVSITMLSEMMKAKN